MAEQTVLLEAVVAKVIQRNLMLYLYPKTIGQKWRRAVNHLLARWDQFDGRKIVAIARCTNLDPPDVVRRAFGARQEECEFIEHDNTHLQEVQPFAQLLEGIVHEPGITLYAHGKGSTHIADGAASHIWCDAMAAACLDYPRLVECALGDKAIAGAFRSIQPIGFSPSSWHFAGTWWWVRNDSLRAKRWGDFEQVFWGTESYPGRHFAMHESRCLFFDGAQTQHLYTHAAWEHAVGPAFKRWTKRLAECGLKPISENPPVTEQFRKWMQ